MTTNPRGPTPTNGEILDIVIGALDRLMAMFRIERYVHLALTGLSFLMVLYCGFRLVTDSHLDRTSLLALFGSTGLITASSARITVFFSRAFTIVESVIKRLHR